jgi:hypothetical protein
MLSITKTVLSIINEYEALVEWYWQGKQKYSEKGLP